MGPMTRILKLAGILVLVLIVAAGAFALLFDIDQFRPTIQAQLEASLKRKVVLGPISLGLFPPALRVQDVTVGENPPLVKASELSVRAALLPLLQKKVEISSLRLAQPIIELVEGTDGHWNYETPGDSKSDTALSIGELMVENGQVAITATGAAREVYDHIDLTLRDYAPDKPFSADLAVTLPQSLKLEAAMKARNAADALTVESLEATLGKLALTGSGVLSSKATNFALKIEKSSISDLAQVAAAFGKAFSPEMKVAGELAADVRLTGPTDKLAYNGTVNLTGLEVSEKGWAQPVRVPEAKVDLTPTTIRTNTFTVESGATKVQASATVNGYAGGGGNFEARLRAPSAKLEELLHMAAVYGGAALDGVSATGDASLDVTVRGKLASAAEKDRTPKEPAVNYAGSGSLTNATVRVPSLKKPVEISQTTLKFSDDQISVDKAGLGFGSSHATGTFGLRGFAKPEVKFQVAIDKVDTAELQANVVSAPEKAGGKKQPLALRGSGTVSIGQVVSEGLVLQNVRADADIREGVITLDPLTAEMFGGKQVGTVTIDTRAETTTYALRAKLERVDANQLLSSTTSLKQKIFGLMAASSNLRFAPKPGEDIARSLNGTLSMQLFNGKLAGINLVNQMAGLAKLAGFRQSGEAVTNILGLTGNLQLDNGVAQTNDLKLTFDGGSLAGAGTVNLVDQAISMKVTTVMSKGFSGQFTENKIGGLLTSVLANKNGELVIPAIISGSFAAPRFAPDAAEIAKLRVQGLAGGGAAGLIDAATKGGGAKGILDAITGRGQNQQNGPQQNGQQGDQKGGSESQPRQDPAQSIIDLFKKKKNQ